MFTKKILKILFVTITLVGLSAAYAKEVDPTRPPSSQNGGERGLVVQSIMFKKDKSVALINNEYYEIGSIVSGAKIVDIKPDLVQFRDSEGEFSVVMNAVGEAAIKKNIVSQKNNNILQKKTNGDIGEKNITKSTSQLNIKKNVYGYTLKKINTTKVTKRVVSLMKDVRKKYG